MAQFLQGATCVPLKTTKVALRAAIKGVASDTVVNAEFREDDGILIMATNTEETL